MADMDRVLDAYLGGQLSRTAFVRRAIALGLSVSTATSLATAYAETKGSASSAQSSSLTLAAAATPTTLDPEFSSSPQDRESDVSVYDRFTQFAVIERNGVKQANLTAPPQPLLAESWHVSNHGQRYIFNLRQGVKSYFGNELTTADVIWSWDRVFAQQSQGLFPLNVSSVGPNSYKALGRYTLEVNLENPNPLLPVVLATPVPGAVIYDSTEVKRHATASDKWARGWLATHTASFGPYHATQFVAGQQAVFVANPHYYGTKPAIGSVLYKEIPDPASRFTLLQTGQVDIAEDLDAEQRKALSRASGVSILNVPGNLWIAFGLNNTQAPFNDPRVRQAIAYATPVNNILSTVFFNEPTVRLFKGYVADSFPGYPNYWPYQPPAIQKAKQLLRQAGKTSLSFELSYTTTYPEHEKIAQVIRTGLQQINVDVVLNKLTPATYQEQYYKHQAQAILVQDAAFVADTAYPLYLSFGAGKGAVGNWINYTHAAVQQQISKALATPNLTQRKNLAMAADLAVMRDAPWAMLLGIGYHLPARTTVSGFVWRPHNLIQFHDLVKA